MGSIEILGKWKSWFKPWLPPRFLEFYGAARSHLTSKERAEAAEEEVQFSLPSRALGKLFPAIESIELDIPVSQIYRQDEWALPLTELLTVAAICKYTRPRKILEIGTYTGSTTLLMATNTPRETQVFTLDLDPAQRDTHRHGLGVGGFPTFTVGSAYQGTPFASKIRQLFGNSVTFDYSALAGSIDLVLIDADHTYDFVKVDSANAFKLLRPGGIIIWDDYLWNERYPECQGVTRLLDELQGSTACFQIAGTRFAVYLDGQ